MFTGRGEKPITQEHLDDKQGCMGVFEEDEEWEEEWMTYVSFSGKGGEEQFLREEDGECKESIGREDDMEDDNKDDMTGRMTGTKVPDRSLICGSSQDAPDCPSNGSEKNSPS